ncbi:MAG: ATP-binding protein [Deltaproteobacteria bacterium]|nr:ATP-binding protein [Deltaproteobacteria bacterium]MBW1933225.1 ATP-binding protein [Deltaproteobacteria bacterium]MBW1965431.1 ATP-binding protein [Deltaproteobacteria bacterium]MBW2081002.1 ATP-binding protein [Deltaproteobacteria bacterium]
MQELIKRYLADTVKRRLRNNPAVAILGPRQCGKTTLASQIVNKFKQSIYLDLENPSDLAKLDDPLAFFSLHNDDLVCLDEIQRAPELFSILRSIIDERARNGQFLILGSAGPDLIRQSSESLAGRISYLDLTPFLISELEAAQKGDMRRLWLRGGFPRSYLAEDSDISFQWRQDFIRTFLERDIGMLGFRMPPARLSRFWKMCAHMHGSLLNASKLADSLGVSSHTVRSYIDLLGHTFMLRVLLPDTQNLKKRLVKSPKIYIRDSGILHTLLDIRTHDDLLSHPILGASFEGFAMENILAFASNYEASFYRTSAGAEIDLILRKGRRILAFELKSSTVPRVTKGFWNALNDISPDEAYVVAPVKESYPMKGGVMVSPLQEIIRTFHP